jgi:YesN/AraC family two-component response regulator
MFDFSKALKECNILYCEDIESIRMTFELMLQDKADNITYAEDGRIGLEKYLFKTPDIIITDIEMPNKNGLEMISEIKKLNNDIPIIIVTSRGDQESLLNAIDMGVDKFLIKPVRNETLLPTLEKVLLALEDKKIADEYRKNIELETLRENTKHVVSQLSDVFIEPIMIIQNDNVKYTNEAFENFMGSANMNLLREDYSYFNSLLEIKDGFSQSLSNSCEELPYNNIISTNIDNERKIFQIAIKCLYFEGEDDKSIIYVFQDITVLEYQKLKIQIYSLRLENYLIESKYETKNTPNIALKHEEKKQEKVEKINAQHEEKRNLNKLEEGLLKKSHAYKISAKDFQQNLDTSIHEDFDKLKDIEVEINDSFDGFLENPSIELLQSIVLRLDSYAYAIKNLKEFDELARALFSTKEVLNAVTEVDTKKAEIIKIFMKNIIDDLKSWRNTIFIMKDTQDIHYLDSSLFSSCLQMELSLTGVKADNDEDNFELF